VTKKHTPKPNTGKAGEGEEGGPSIVVQAVEVDPADVAANADEAATELDERRRQDTSPPEESSHVH